MNADKIPKERSAKLNLVLVMLFHASFILDFCSEKKIHIAKLIRQVKTALTSQHDVGVLLPLWRSNRPLQSCPLSIQPGHACPNLIAQTRVTAQQLARVVIEELSPRGPLQHLFLVGLGEDEKQDTGVDRLNVRNYKRLS